MNAVFRKNLTGAIAVGANDVGTASDTGGALYDGTDWARFRRTTATMHLGRERPPENWARDRDRGVAEGVAHAPDVSLTAADGRAHGDTGGTERRPVQRGEVVHSQRHRPIDLKSTTFMPPRVSTESGAPRRGNTAPESVFPPLFRHSKSNGLQQGVEPGACGGSGIAATRAPASP